MASPAGDLLALADDQLAEILIRLPALADLGRACCACPAFRRVISSHAFLRRLRALHPPSLLGILTYAYLPAQPPHPSAAAARTFADAAAADFFCSFLPSRDRWSQRDVSDGRVLFSAIPKGSSDRDYDRRVLVKDLAVCDPIHRRYLLLPVIPDELAAVIHQPVVDYQPFLAPPACEEDGGSSFRVICLAQCTSKLVVFVFSSARGQWHASQFGGWSALIAGSGDPNPGFQPELSTRYYAHRCFCWVMRNTQKMLVLDTRTMKFSCADIPPANPMRQRAIVEADDGKFGVITVHVDMLYGTYQLFYTVLQKYGQDAKVRYTRNIIPLPPDYRFTIMGVAGGYLLLQGIPVNLFSFPLSERPNLDYFSLNLKTFDLEWFFETKHPIILAPLYAGFPRSLSAPTI